MKNYENKTIDLIQEGSNCMIYYIDRIEGICSHFSYYKSLRRGWGKFSRLTMTQIKITVYRPSLKRVKYTLYIIFYLDFPAL